MSPIRQIQRASRRHLPRGTSMPEILVALTLISTVITASTTLIVRNGRMLTSQRDYRLAIDELSNQLDRITSLPQADRLKALEQLEPSEFTAERLPGVKLTGELGEAEPGQRLILCLQWNEPQREKAPVAMAAWIFPTAGRRENNSPENSTP